MKAQTGGGFKKADSSTAKVKGFINQTVVYAQEISQPGRGIEIGRQKDQ